MNLNALFKGIDDIIDIIRDSCEHPIMYFFENDNYGLCLICFSCQTFRLLPMNWAALPAP